MSSTVIDRAFLTRFAWLSIGAALLTIGLKAGAYLLTNSVSLLSDALESFVNLAGALMALAMLTVAARPPDEDHAYGHSKAEYFSTGVEGTLILIAAVSIGVTAVRRLITPAPLEQIGLGVATAVAAALVNLIVAYILMQAGQRYDSVALQANARHLLTDVWTTAAVLLGLGAVSLTGWERLDPVVALLVAANIIWSGGRILRQSVSGLMDAALPQSDLEILRQVLARYNRHGIQYHALRTRQAGARRFVSVHILVPGTWTVRRGHRLLERIEADIRHSLANTIVFTHLEPLEDAASWADADLDREDSPPSAKPPLSLRKGE
jgi:cation diffusion facilitator family transporter